MIENILMVMAIIGAIVTLREIYIVSKKKKDVSVTHYAVMIVSQTLVLPIASVNLYKDATVTDIVVFIVLLGIIIGSAVTMAINKSDC